MLVVIEVIVWLCFLLVLYSYVLYPILLILFSSFLQAFRDTKFILNGECRRTVDIDYYPKVSVVISAYNEEDCISQRINNLLNLDYPTDKIEFFIGSDGSVDKTSEIAGSFQDERLRFINFDENRGKAVVLNDLVEMTEGDILVFSDANTFYEEGAVKKLVRHFNNKDYGAVCGELKLVDGESNENLDGLYWKYERILKFNESRIGALLGANGAIYAVRKALYMPIPSDTIVDDFTIALNVSLSKYKVCYDPEAIAFEEVAPTTGDEFNRRIRIGSGNYQALHRFKRLLNPFHGRLFWTYISHKVMRWLSPVFLLIALLGSAFLSNKHEAYSLFFVLQLIVYLVAYYLRNKPISNKLINFVIFWVNMNIALGLGAIRYYSGAAKGTWDSTKR